MFNILATLRESQSWRSIPEGKLYRLLKPASPSTQTVLKPFQSPETEAGQEENTCYVSKTNKFQECTQRMTKESQTSTEAPISSPPAQLTSSIQTSYPRHQEDMLRRRPSPIRAPVPSRRTPPSTPTASWQCVRPRCRRRGLRIWLASNCSCKCLPRLLLRGHEGKRADFPSRSVAERIEASPNSSPPPPTATYPQVPPRRRKPHRRREAAPGEEGEDVDTFSPRTRGRVSGCRRGVGKDFLKVERGVRWGGPRGAVGALRSGRGRKNSGSQVSRGKGVGHPGAWGKSRLGWGRGRRGLVAIKDGGEGRPETRGKSPGPSTCGRPRPPASAPPRRLPGTAARGRLPAGGGRPGLCSLLPAKANSARARPGSALPVLCRRCPVTTASPVTGCSQVVLFASSLQG